ncbi:MAG: TIGR02301 family protein [Bauldia sp.]|nr:TIGR02301 family protein [Bauldia sp.]
MIASGLAAAANAEETEEPAAPEPAVTTPYDESLLRLSEILGAIHYMRHLCNSDEGGLWRDQMQALLDSDQASPARRARFVDSFNRGYESFKAVYRSCTPAATLAIDRYMDEGARIARDVVVRYGRQE